jgi:hypothetical protein
MDAQHLGCGMPIDGIGVNGPRKNLTNQISEGHLDLHQLNNAAEWSYAASALNLGGPRVGMLRWHQ